MSGLPPSWAKAPLNAVVASSVGGMWGSAEQSHNDIAVRVIRGAEFRDWQSDRARSAPRRFIPGSGFPSRRLNAGDIVLEVSGGGPTQPVGRTVLIDEQAVSSVDAALVCSNFCRRLVLAPEMDPRFVWYQLQHAYLRGDTDTFQRATTNIRNLQVPRYLAETTLAIAPGPEQERIALAIEEEFSRLDAGVAMLERALRNLKRMRAAVLEAAVTGRLVPPPDSNDATSLLDRIDTDRQRTWEDHTAKPYRLPAEPSDFPISVPDHWRIASLEALTDPIRVICYGILMPKENVSSGVPYVRVKDMKGWQIDVPGLRRTTPEIAQQYARASLMPDDVLLAIRGSYGRVAIIPLELEGANITQDSARIAAHPAIDLRYLLYYLGGSVANRYYSKVARGVAVKGVNIGDLRTMPVPVPPIGEQAAIADEVEKLFAVIDRTEASVTSQLRRASSSRSAILAAAFSGTLAPQDTNDESATILLERVATERALADGHQPSRVRKPQRSQIRASA